MKKLLKILLAVSIVCGVSLPVLAEIIDVTFNRVSIMVDGNGPLERDQNIKNTELPLSITYKNTTYVPLRFISEQMYKQVQWNGDSKTVSITRKTFGHGNRIKKTDLNGNEWEYQYTRSDDGKKYITVTDSKRNFVRNYPIQGEKAYKTDQESVWFMHTNGILYRLFYANDVNSQDGEEIAVVNSGHPANEAIFDGDYIYSVEKLFSNSSQGNIVVYNMVTNEKVTYPADTWCSFSELSFGRGKTNDENEVVLYFSENSYTGDVYDCRITFNKSDMTFEGFKKGESEKE